MTSRISEIQLDVEDLSKLLEIASRQKSKDFLSLEIRKLQSEITSIQNQIANNDPIKTSNSVNKPESKCYDVQISNYAWDQTFDTVKLYITLNNVHTLPKEATSCEFSNRSLKLRVSGLENKNYSLHINNLCEDINTENSNFKVKKNMIIITLSKILKENWSCITSIEKKLKDSKNASMTDMASETNDPEASLMNLMKKMYQDGDDEMKRSIAKAWTESQEKKSQDLNMGF